MYEEYLMHYGVKGMKWGVRKDRYYAKKGRKRRKKVSQMSDEELQKKIKRIRLESEYKSVTKKKSKIGKALGVIATTVIVPSLTVWGKKEVGKILNRGSQIGGYYISELINNRALFQTGQEFLESMFKK